MNQPMFEIKEEGKGSDYGKFILTPLEQGYGLTIGNSLRRVLLTSLKGSAVTSVKIVGVKHQFSTLTGMKEDIVDFILNLKKVRFSGTTESAKILLSYFGQIVSPKKAEKKEEVIVNDLGVVGKLSVEEIGLPTRVA